MPEEGVPLTPSSQLLSTDEIIRIARLFVESGVTKIRLTGGEPSIRKDIIEIVARLNELKSLGLEKIGMTTNGIALKRKLPHLIDAGLDSLNISLDTLDKFKFELITRRKGFEAVCDTINMAAESPIETKVNCVVIKNVNDDEIVDFVSWTRDKDIYMRFIEYMPFDGNKWSKDKFVSYRQLLSRIQETYPVINKAEDEPNDTSKRYRIPDSKGSFGFITSMSDHFCHTCNRLRITADGNLKVCLFGQKEISLRDVIRSGSTDSDLLDVISLAVKRKKGQHAGMFELAKGGNRPMILIGG